MIYLLLVYPFYCFHLNSIPLCSGEKRKLPEALTLEDAKRIRVMGDIPMELVNEVMMTITDPAAMLGPEVSQKSIKSKVSLIVMTSIQMYRVPTLA